MFRRTGEGRSIRLFTTLRTLGQLGLLRFLAE